MALTPAERDEFLAQPHIAALSVSVGPDRGPLTVPVWYQYAPGGQPWVLTGADSRKRRALDDAGHFSLMVERLAPSIRYVTVEGAVDRIVPGTEDMLREMAKRYLPPEAVDGYVRFASEDHGEQVAVYMQPRHWLSSDLGSV